MTREEAIVIMENERPHCGKSITFTEEEKCEAYDMAIKALKAEPCDTLKLDGMLEDAYEYGYEQARHDFEVQPCEDTISRKHLLSEIDELMQSPWFNSGKDDEKFTHYGYIERKEAVEIVRDLCVKTEPPVTPKPRTGKWNEYYTSQKGNNVFACELCGATFIVIQGKHNMNFCPDCGAKMEGVSE